MPNNNDNGNKIILSEDTIVKSNIIIGPGSDEGTDFKQFVDSAAKQIERTFDKLRTKEPIRKPNESNEAEQPGGGNRQDGQPEVAQDVEVQQPVQNVSAATSGLIQFFSGNASVDGGGTVPAEIIDASGTKWLVQQDPPIGAGAFGSVHHGKPFITEVAMKFFRVESDRWNTEEVKKEVSLLAKLSHENIVSYVNCAATETYFIIIMEYVRGGSLHSLLNPALGQTIPLSLVTLKRFLPGILRGLQYLHGKGCIHCDIKPHNILIDRDTIDDTAEETVKGPCKVKIADVGSAILFLAAQNGVSGRGSITALLSQNDVGAVVANNPTLPGRSGTGPMVRGTAHYMAPEAARNKSETASDIWSLGVTVFELVTGRLPWPAMSQTNFLVALESDRPPQPIFPLGLHQDVKNFVRRCLVPDARGRSNIGDLLGSRLVRSCVEEKIQDSID